MEKISPQNNWLVKFNPEELLDGQLFYIIGNQILFEHNKQLVVSQISNKKEYTKDDYMLLPEGAPYQLIHGKLIFMASAKTNHQIISNNLSLEISIQVKKHKLGEILTAPMDVHFDKKNIFQPDLLFVSIKRKAIIKDWIMGAPDFVVEILSKSTEKRDRNQKMQTYGQYEVIEYWIVNLSAENIEVYHNKNKEMQLVQTAEKNNTIVSKAIDGFELDVAKIFE